MADLSVRLPRSPHFGHLWSIHCVDAKTQSLSLELSFPGLTFFEELSPLVRLHHWVGVQLVAVRDVPAVSSRTASSRVPKLGFLWDHSKSVSDFYERHEEMEVLKLCKASPVTPAIGPSHTFHGTCRRLRHSRCEPQYTCAPVWQCMARNLQRETNHLPR